MTAGRASRCSLVTGGAGFIGSHLVEHLLARGDRVIVIDDLSTGRRENLSRFPADRINFIHDTVIGALEQLRHDVVSEIYHLAAAVGVRLVIDEPVHTIETNIHETSRLLRFASKARTPILIASSSEVYGKSTQTPFREDDDVVYGPTIYPRWSYACSKAIDEYLALAHHREAGVPAVIVRFFNTVGPRQIGRYGMVLPRFVEAALARRPLEVHGDGQQIRCFCDVRDIVPALPRLLAHPACAGRVFNIGSNRVISIQQLAELVCQTLDSDSEIRYVTYEDAFGRDFDDLRVRQPDLTRVRQAIGFEPSIPLEQTILDIAATIRSEAVSARSEARTP